MYTQRPVDVLLASDTYVESPPDSGTYMSAYADVLNSGPPAKRRSQGAVSSAAQFQVTVFFLETCIDEAADWCVRLIYGGIEEFTSTQMNDGGDYGRICHWDETFTFDLRSGTDLVFEVEDRRSSSVYGECELGCKPEHWHKLPEQHHDMTILRDGRYWGKLTVSLEYIGSGVQEHLYAMDGLAQTQPLQMQNSRRGEADVYPASAQISNDVDFRYDANATAQIPASQGNQFGTYATQEIAPVAEVRTILRDVPEVDIVEKLVPVPTVEVKQVIQEMPLVVRHEKVEEVEQRFQTELVEQVVKSEYQDREKRVRKTLLDGQVRQEEVQVQLQQEELVEVPQVQQVPLTKEVMRHMPQTKNKEVEKLRTQVTERVEQVSAVTVQQKLVEKPIIQEVELRKEVPAHKVEKVEKRIAKPEVEVVVHEEPRTFVEHHQKAKEVEEKEIVQVIRQEPKIETRYTERKIKKEIVEIVEKIVEVPMVVTVEEIVEVPQVIRKELVREVIKPIVKYVDRQVAKPQMRYVDRYEEVPMTLQVEKAVEVPRIEQVELVTERPRPEVKKVEKQFKKINLKAEQKLVEVPVRLQRENAVQKPEVQQVDCIRQQATCIEEKRYKEVVVPEVHAVERQVEVPVPVLKEEADVKVQKQVVEVVREEPREIFFQQVKQVPKTDMQYVERQIEVSTLFERGNEVVSSRALGGTPVAVTYPAAIASRVEGGTYSIGLEVSKKDFKDTQVGRVVSAPAGRADFTVYETRSGANSHGGSRGGSRGGSVAAAAAPSTGRTDFTAYEMRSGRRTVGGSNVAAHADRSAGRTDFTVYETTAYETQSGGSRGGSNVAAPGDRYVEYGSVASQLGGGLRTDMVMDNNFSVGRTVVQDRLSMTVPTPASAQWVGVEYVDCGDAAIMDSARFRGSSMPRGRSGIAITDMPGGRYVTKKDMGAASRSNSLNTLPLGVQDRLNANVLRMPAPTPATASWVSGECGLGIEDSAKTSGSNLRTDSEGYGGSLSMPAGRYITQREISTSRSNSLNALPPGDNIGGTVVEDRMTVATPERAQWVGGENAVDSSVGMTDMALASRKVPGDSLSMTQPTPEFVSSVPVLAEESFSFTQPTPVGNLKPGGFTRPLQSGRISQT